MAPAVIESRGRNGREEEALSDVAAPRDASRNEKSRGPAFLRRKGNGVDRTLENEALPTDSEQASQNKQPIWTMGMLNDPLTEEVPGSILLLSKASRFNEPLGLQDTPERMSSSSLPSPFPTPSIRRSLSRQRRIIVPEKKRTTDGTIVLEPQPDDSLNDPLNWKIWRRDTALFSLGFYCLLGGGMTTVLAAGFNDIAAQFNTDEASVALTTGLYMMGLGLGSVVLSPTAILYGKRPVYLIAAICFIIAAVWCALSPNLTSLIVARIFMGFAVSSVECLPSASVAEIYFLHEKAYRLGIYTLLLLGGKNLVPLVSAAIIQSLGWRWVFWVVAVIVAFAWLLLFFFVPETFWDRTPRPHRHILHLNRPRSYVRTHSTHTVRSGSRSRNVNDAMSEKSEYFTTPKSGPEKSVAKRHAHFQTDVDDDAQDKVDTQNSEGEKHAASEQETSKANNEDATKFTTTTPTASVPLEIEAIGNPSPERLNKSARDSPAPSVIRSSMQDVEQPFPTVSVTSPNKYTEELQKQPPKSFVQSLRPWSGRLRGDSWLRCAVRPFILFAYPSLLWSALVYALSVGWLIVLSESVAHIYEDADTYNFTALQTGLVYLSPFIGGVLGTAVAGKFSDIVVRFMARKNGGLYEPEFRLVMAIPVTITTVIGLMGYGWSAAERDLWIVPTIFFGLISFGCTLGSTTAITFAVDSYRQYAGEALVTLNFSKNIFHGMVFSLFFNNWLQSDGSEITFIAIGCIQLCCLATTIPMYIYGKRARMWTVRKNLMEKW